MLELIAAVREAGVIVFRSLNHDDIREIVLLETEKLRSRVQENGLNLELTEAAQEWLAVNGYNPEYGARPLKRLIQQEVETPLSDSLLGNDYEPGDTVIVDSDEDGIVIQRAEEPEMMIETP